MGFYILLEIDHIFLEQKKQFFKNESVFVLYSISNRFSSQDLLVLLDHPDKSFNLFLIFFLDLLIRFELEAKTFSLIDPIDPFTPSLRII